MSRRVRSTTICVLLLSGATGFFSSGTALAASGPAAPDADGTLHIPALTLPISEFLSPEFKQAYSKNVARMSVPLSVPAMNAPKGQWDKLDAEYDRTLAEFLAWDLDNYPVNVSDTKIAGVHVGIVLPKGGIAPENQHRVLINLHGGGFFLGRGLVGGQVESIPIASIGRIKVITIDYRQAPYYKYPAATQDVEAVYNQLLKQYNPKAIGIFGGSAGGTLAAQAIAWLQAKGIPRPGAVGIFWAAPVPYGKRGDSTIWGVGGVPFGARPSLPGADDVAHPTGYLEGADITDPKAFPGSSDAALAKFPPTLLLSGTRSEEMSAVVAAHSHFLKLGVNSFLYIMEGGWHGAAVSCEGAPEGYAVNAYVAQWFDQHLER